MEQCRSVLRVAEAEFHACGNEAGWVPEVVADAGMDYDADGVAFGDEQIDGIGKLQLPALAWLDATKGIKNRHLRRLDCHRPQHRTALLPA